MIALPGKQNETRQRWRVFSCAGEGRWGAVAFMVRRQQGPENGKDAGRNQRLPVSIRLFATAFMRCRIQATGHVPGGFAASVQPGLRRLFDGQSPEEQLSGPFAMQTMPVISLFCFLPLLLFPDRQAGHPQPSRHSALNQRIDRRLFCDGCDHALPCAFRIRIPMPLGRRT